MVGRFPLKLQENAETEKRSQEGVKDNKIE